MTTTDINITTVMTDIAIYGAGGLGREVAAMIKMINDRKPTWNFVGFIDDTHTPGDEISHYGKVIGGRDMLNAMSNPPAIVICVGSPAARRAIVESITNPAVEYPNLISPDFVIEDEQTFNMGIGNIIKSHCRVTVNVSVGDFNVLNGMVTFGHDAKVGNCNVFMPGVRISGESVIGDCNLFGAGSFVKQGLHVGNGITLSPLSPLLTRPKDGCTYIGNPAKIFKF